MTGVHHHLLPQPCSFLEGPPRVRSKLDWNEGTLAYGFGEANGDESYADVRVENLPR